MLPFIVIGLVTGSVFGLGGVGLVLTYRTSGVFNFAQGAIATVAAFGFYELHIQNGVSWPVAAVVSVVATTLILALVMERLAEVISQASLAVRVTGVVGVLLVLEGIIILIYGVNEPRLVPNFLGSDTFDVGGTQVQYSQLYTVLFAVAVTAALSLYLRFSRAGLAMRAVAARPQLLELSGTSAVKTRRNAWFIGTTLAACSGVLFASLLPLDAFTLTLLVVQGFGAAALGGFRSLPLTFLGGLLIGVVASLCTKWFSSGILVGLPQALPFVVLFAVLLLAPRRYLVDSARVVPPSRSTWSAPWQMQLAGGLALIALLAFVPSFAGVHIVDWTTAMASVIIFLSLGLMVKTSGYVSLCQVAFMAIGVSAFSRLAVDLEFPWLLALIGSGVIAIPIGALLAIPAIRLSGLFLAIATFGFGVLLSAMFYTSDLMFGSTGAGLTVPRPATEWLATDTGFFYLVCFFAMLATAVVVALNHSRFGRLLRGMADSPLAVSASGASINVTRVLVFCLSAAMAAVGGALAGMAQGNAGAGSYSPLLSLTYLALIMIVIGNAPWYALIAAFGLVLFPSYVSGDDTQYWLQVLFGVFALLYAMTPSSKRGVPPAVAGFIDSRLRRSRAEATPAESAAEAAVAPRPQPSGPAPAHRLEKAELEVRDLSVHFGGLVAVNEVSLTAPTGRITGLIGPNGAGKTTLFNVCSGLQRPTAGHVYLDGNDISRRSVAVRARRGLGRTFQQTQLFDSLSVKENVAIGREAMYATADPLSHIASRPAAKEVVSEATREALALCEIEHLADVSTATLSTGQRRLVEFARCLAGEHRILLLDEPSAGLDRSETARFGEILGRVVAERGVGILLVEHDMSLVMDMCQHIYVLEFGSVIMEGSVNEVSSSESVRDAYLGEEHGGSDDERSLSSAAPEVPE